MRLTRDMPVHAEDGQFGQLADIVIDAFTHKVTHLVVDPGGDHQQLRLVPLWLANEIDGELRVALPASHIRQLQRALDSDYVRLPAKLVTGAEVVRFKRVLTLPHYRDPTITGRGDESEGVPLHSCEIRRSSWVVDRHTHMLGTVAGLLLRSDTVHSMVVRTNVVGPRQHVAVPMSAVESVGSHFVALRASAAEFKRMPVTHVLPAVNVSFRPRELWREVLGLPTNKLWDDFAIDGRADLD